MVLMSFYFGVWEANCRRKPNWWTLRSEPDFLCWSEHCSNILIWIRTIMKEITTMFLSKTKSLIKKIPGSSKAYSLLKAFSNFQNPYLKKHPPGHFYSPIPDLDYIQKHQEDLFSRDKISIVFLNKRVNPLGRTHLNTDWTKWTIETLLTPNIVLSRFQTI